MRLICKTCVLYKIKALLQCRNREGSVVPLLFVASRPEVPKQYRTYSSLLNYRRGAGDIIFCFCEVFEAGGPQQYRTILFNKEGKSIWRQCWFPRPNGPQAHTEHVIPSKLTKKTGKSIFCIFVVSEAAGPQRIPENTLPF